MEKGRFPVVYLPVEMRSREFDSKALLALRLAARGYAVVLGQQWMLYVNLARLPPGVVLFKSFNQIHQRAMLEARRAGHRVAALEEEMLAQIEERAVLAMCIEGIFEAADLIVCNGEFEASIMRRAGAGRARVEVGGNGRIDLLKPALRGYFDAEVANVRRRYGEFILVNTNFSISNSIWQDTQQVTQVQMQAGFVRAGDAQSMQTWQEYIDFELANRAALESAIRELAQRRPADRILVRPHPGEELARWDGVFDGLQNVQVVREGSHVPWTLACRLLLHTSCTTGYEAQVAGKPALSLVPRRGWISESLISNRVNPVFEDPMRLVDAACAILDGGAVPAPSTGAQQLEHYIWNGGEHDATARLVELLTEGLPEPDGFALPPLTEVSRDERFREKFSLSVEACGEALRRLAGAARVAVPEARTLGESLFLVTAAQKTASISISPPKPDHGAVRAEMQSAYEAGKAQQTYESFKRNFGEAHRHGDLCFLAGLALFDLGKYALALEYMQQALAATNAAQPEILFGLARCHHRLGQLEEARRYAEHAWRVAPAQAPVFDLFKELAARTRQPVPTHWLVIGCSHVRYFRYLQLNQARYFDWRVQLECYEFAGATAFGLGNESSQAGALPATRQLRARLSQSDRVLVYFGEIDCRRAAWKAAQTLGRPVEEMIAQSAARLHAYVEREILPYKKKVLILGAKPQIVGDEDFYRNSLEDERTVFQPLPERERITLLYNSLLRQAAERLRVQYADIDHVLADEKGRKQLFRKAFWDGYTTDTHGNVDFFAGLYFRKLQEFV